MAAGVVGARRPRGPSSDRARRRALCRCAMSTARRHRTPIEPKETRSSPCLAGFRHDAEAEAPGPHLAAQAGCVERPHLGPPCGEHRRDDLRAGFKPSPGGGNRIGPDTIRCRGTGGADCSRVSYPAPRGAGAARDVQEAERATTPPPPKELSGGVALRRHGLPRGHRRGGTGDRDGDKDGPWAPCSPGHLLLELPAPAGPRRRSRARSDHGEHARPAASYEVSSASEE